MSKFNIDFSKIADVSGTFETHIIVSPNDQAKLFAFCAGDKNMKPTCAQSFYGNYPNQPMITFWNVGMSKQAVQKTIDTAILMDKYGMSVKRLKVEAMATNGEISEAQPLDKSSNNYFEFHFKVDSDSMDDWNKLKDICVKYGSHLFFNPYSKSGQMVPVVTLRRYGTDFKTSYAECMNLYNEIKSSGLNPHEKIQKEFSILDTDVYYDQGWLFESDPKVFITSF